MWTIKDLYNWAVANGLEDAYLVTTESDNTIVGITEVYEANSYEGKYIGEKVVEIF